MKDQNKIISYAVLDSCLKLCIYSIKTKNKKREVQKNDTTDKLYERIPGIFQ